MSELKDFYTALLNTGHNIGIDVLSDDACCKLMAWVYAYGGGLEAVTQNERLNADITHAQDRLNIKGGEIVTPHLFAQLKVYLKEVEPYLNKKYYYVPQWAKEIFIKYGIEPPKDYIKPMRIKRQRGKSFTPRIKRRRTK
jgi:hypothetical protein